MDDIIRSREGALIVIGDPNELFVPLLGGIRLDVPFTGQLLYRAGEDGRRNHRQSVGSCSPTRTCS